MLFVLCLQNGRVRFNQLRMLLINKTLQRFMYSVYNKVLFLIDPLPHY